ncbi:type IV pilus assembly protein PilZ [Ahrensia sp. R2A130]|nr:type IV pilus assembly protein PilZ [Ahrensia sp. R2A130]
MAQEHSIQACRAFQTAFYDSLSHRKALSQTIGKSSVSDLVEELRSSIVAMKALPYFQQLKIEKSESVPAALTVKFIIETQSLLQRYRGGARLDKRQWLASSAMEDVVVSQLCNTEKDMARADSGFRVLDYALAQNYDRTISKPRPTENKPSDLGFTSGSKPAAIFLGVLALGLVPALIFLDKMESRKARRYKLSLEAVMVLEGRETIAFIIDLSSSGAKLECIATVEKDTRIKLLVDDLEIPARVVWSGGGNIGLQFTTPLPKRAVKDLRGASRTKIRRR